MTKPTASTLALLLAGASLAPVTAAHAQASAPAPAAAATDSARSDSAIVVTGTRSTNRRALESVSPIDVFNAAALVSTGQTSITDALAQISPAVSTLQFGEDLGALTASIKLHGLSPDDTLVLVNGKRRHPTGYIYAPPGPQQGSTPADLDMIPMSGVDHIEVLRDGASAQYGSDAVAGVVNIIMKSGASGGSLTALGGGYIDGGGLTGNVGGDMGFKLPNNGFVHISADVRYQGDTNRSGVDTRYNAVVEKAFGSPKNVRETAGINAEEPLGDTVTAYGFGTYAHRKADGNEFYRELPGLYANGYAPVETVDENDYAATAGIKGTDLAGFTWDLSSTYGDDHINAGMTDSANASLYAATGSSPTSFHLGAYDNSQWTNNLDLSRPLNLGLPGGPATLAFGAEYRRERYEIEAGEPDSYYGSGTSGLPGLPPSSAGSHDRNVYAGYGDLDLHVTHSWEVDLAGRVENYSDIGTHATGKVSTRYAISPDLALRGTFTNGIRAPSLAQEYFSNLGVSPSAASGQLAVNSDAARLLGATPLKPERSTNISFGMVASPFQGVHFTLDAYQIKIRDRIVDGGTYTGAQAVAALNAGGFGIPSTVDPSAVSAQYYTNGADTRTRGIDMTADYLMNLGASGAIDWSIAAELNISKVTHIGYDSNGNILLNAQNIAWLTTASAPHDKVTVGGEWKDGKIDLSVHEIRWGQMNDQVQYTDGPNAFSGTTFLPFNQKARYTTNLEVGYNVTTAFKLAVGGTNIFNAHPPLLPADARLLGVTVYDYSASQIGINGGFLYARATVRF